MKIDKQLFGVAPDNQEIFIYTLSNNKGSKVKIINQGCKIVSIEVPDLNGNLTDVVLGFSTLEDYLNGLPYMGSVIGRCTNRIGEGKFKLEGKEYQLKCNVDGAHLHGGEVGFNDKIWNATVIKENGINSLELTYTSEDEEEGYPGILKSKLLYTFTEDDELLIELSATTDKTTIVNLTTHPFFNLNGDGRETILNHYLKINASCYLPMTDKSVPTGEIASVKDTPMDFNQFKQIGKDIESDNEQIKIGRGFDHNFVLDKEDNSLTSVAEVFSPLTGIRMDVYTTEPGLQLYTGNWLDGSDIGKRGVAYNKHSAFCLETQHFPDSINNPEFPSVILKPDQEYRHTTIYKFSIF